MFVNRMMNDPEFAERIHKQQKEAAATSDHGGCPLKASATELDPRAADAFLAADKENENNDRTPLTKEEDAARKMVQGREGEVKVVAQGLAFSGVGAGARASGALGAPPASGDGAAVVALAALLNAAYAGEARGPEAFRDGRLVDGATVAAAVGDRDCNWLTVEAANGRDVEKDGAILGCACVSYVGKRAEIRFFAVADRYRGLCVGARLLDKVERAAVAAGAAQLACCIPSPRKSMRAWAERRGFRAIREAPFPRDALPFAITVEDATVVVYAKALAAAAPKPAAAPPVAEHYDEMD